MRIKLKKNEVCIRCHHVEDFDNIHVFMLPKGATIDGPGYSKIPVRFALCCDDCVSKAIKAYDQRSWESVSKVFPGAISAGPRGAWLDFPDPDEFN